MASNFKQTNLLNFSATALLLTSVATFSPQIVFAKGKSVSPAVQAKMEAGEMFMFHGSYDEAVSQFQKAVALDNTCWQAHTALAQAFMHISDFESGADEYREAIKYNPTDETLPLNLGTLLFQANRFDEAADVFEHAQGKTFQRDDVRLMLASCYLNGGNFKQAKIVYTELNQKSPKNLDYLLGLVGSMYKLGEKEQAVAKIDEALNGGVSDSRIRQLKGEILEENGDSKAAKHAYLEAIKTNANNSEPYISLGNLTLLENDFAESEKYFLQALKLTPTNEDALLGLAYSQEHLGNLESAYANFKKAAAIETNEEKRKKISTHLGQSQFEKFR